MDKLLKPNKFDVNPDDTDAAKQWTYWFKIFTNFLDVIPTPGEGETVNKLALLICHVGAEVYDYISDCPTYDAAILVLNNLYVKPKSEVFCRHLLQTRKQQPSETIDQFLLALKTLSKDCNFTDVNATTYREEAIRDAFINGIYCSNSRQRLFENTSLVLNDAYNLSLIHI